MANTFFVVKLRATCDRDFTDVEGETMCAAAEGNAEYLRKQMQKRLQRIFQDDKIEVKIEV